MFSNDSVLWLCTALFKITSIYKPYGLKTNVVQGSVLAPVGEKQEQSRAFRNSDSASKGRVLSADICLWVGRNDLIGQALFAFHLHDRFGHF